MRKWKIRWGKIIIKNHPSLYCWAGVKCKIQNLAGKESESNAASKYKKKKIEKTWNKNGS